MSGMLPIKKRATPVPDLLPLLKQIRRQMTQQELAERLQVTAKTISRWEKEQTECPPYLHAALREIQQRIVKSALDWSNGSQRDDICLLMARYL